MVHGKGVGLLSRAMDFEQGNQICFNGSFYCYQKRLDKKGGFAVHMGLEPVTAR